jgi:hypothetical protein
VGLFVGVKDGGVNELTCSRVDEDVDKLIRLIKELKELFSSEFLD